MSTIHTTLKISKKMAELLATEFPEDGDTRQKIAAEVAAGRADKTGAVMIDSTPTDTALLHGYTLGSIARLDAELPKADEANKHKLMGEHSAWRALLRQFPERPA